MKPYKTIQDKFSLLNQQAEELILAKGMTKTATNVDDPLKLIHKLQVSQIEQELQIEELHRSQQELMQSKTDYTELYEFAPVGYITTDLKGLMFKANLTLAGMLSTERDNLINQPLSSFIHIDDQDIYYLHLRNLSDSKFRQTCELRLQKNDGSSLDVQIESTVILDKYGDPDKYHTIITNISDRKLAEKKLATSERRLATIIKTIPDIIYRLDEDGRITFISDAVKRYGYSPETLLGKSIIDLVYHKDKDKSKNRMNERRTTDRCISSFEVRLLDKDKKNIHFEIFSVSAVGLYSSKTPTENTFFGTQGIIRDVTERKQAEKEREEIISKLQDALENIKTLSGLVPICSNCKKIRDDEGYWNQIESYIEQHSQAIFNHGLCPICMKKTYGNKDWYKKNQKK